MIHTPFSHPLLRHDPESWRAWPEDDRGLRPMRTGLGELCPEYTNGVLVIGTFNGEEFVCHITNVPPVQKMHFAQVRKNSSSRKPKPMRVTHSITVTEDDLL